MPDEEKKYPKVTVGAVIKNGAGKIFLMRAPNLFDNQYYLPGGHIEWGEKISEALVREVKEETGLTVRDPELVRVVEFIFWPVYDATRHIIPLDYAVTTDDPEESVRLDQREGVEYVWLTTEEIGARRDIEPTSQETIALHFKEQQRQKECAEYKAGWQRAVADYKNLQKETVERRSQLVEMSEEQILEEFIPVYDNFKKAFASQGAGEGNQQNWAMGIKYIMKQFGDILKAHRIEEIATVGEQFNPRWHETVGEEESDRPHGTIVREHEGGYKRGDRIIKVAKVITAK